MVNDEEKTSNMGELAIRIEDKPNEELIRQVINKIWREINSEGFTRINRPPGRSVRTNYESLYLNLKNADKKYSVYLGASQVTRVGERTIAGLDLDVRDNEEDVLKTPDRTARVFQVTQVESVYREHEEGGVHLWKVKYAPGPDKMVAGHEGMSEEERSTFLREILSSEVDKDNTRANFDEAQERASQPNTETVALFWNRERPSRLPLPE